MSSVRGSDTTSTPRNGSSRAIKSDDVKINLKTGRRPYTELTIAGLAAALVGSILVTVLFDLFYMQLPNLLLVPLSMMIMTLPIILVCGLIETRKLGLAGKKFTLDASRVIAFALIGTLVAGAASLALEFIYELGYVYQGVNYDDYIFVIDDSGSMYSSDRHDKRYTALDTLIENMDDSNMVGVIRFSSGVDSELAPAVITDTHRQNVSTFLSSPSSGGGTDIQSAMVRATEMFAASKRSGHPSSIILLSDGASSGVDVAGLADKLNAMDVDICTVALGSGADRKLLQDLADATGGIMLDVGDAEMLRISYKLLNGGSLRRCLLMPRLGSDKGNLLHIVMSILFMGALGSLISLILVAMFHTDPAKDQLPIGIGASFIGAVIHELGNNIGFGKFGRIVMLLLFGLILLQFSEFAFSQRYNLSKGPNNIVRGQDGPTTYTAVPETNYSDKVITPQNTPSTPRSRRGE